MKVQVANLNQYKDSSHNNTTAVARLYLVTLFHNNTIIEHDVRVLAQRFL